MTNFYEEEYEGGATPFTKELDPNFQNSQFVFQGFDSSEATIEILFNGAADYEEVTLEEVAAGFKYLDTVLRGIRISGLPGADPESPYKITGNQWR
jgi:hypothetical protein